MNKKLLFIILAALVALSACNKAEEKPSPERETGISEKSRIENKSFPVSPLTGLKADQTDHRPIAVVINNHTKARPQSGISEADVVYEMLAEGNVTRFLAIFQSHKPKIIGPVRSAREYFVDLSKGYDALLICHGWSPSAKKKLEAGEADYLNGLFYDGTLFKRDLSRKAPHNSYISFVNIQKGALEKHFSFVEKVEPLPFSASAESEGSQKESAPHVYVQYSKDDAYNSLYQYDSNKGKYIRSSGGVQTEDRETHQPITIDNLLIAEMQHKVTDSAGRREIDLTSGGKGLLFQKGSYRKIEWKNYNGRILPYLNNKIVPFVPGKTWINIVPSLEKDILFGQRRIAHAN
ncbi:DUF3048 domain-containing protein [Metabacillus sp. RGM 3146]|uniref:DUF3048 domain-containing protein n=1 Tax=Metabacillus sp. RGM 3146 TaxID=3401092 RepID=UPI003B9C37CB